MKQKTRMTQKLSNLMVLKNIEIILRIANTSRTVTGGLGCRDKSVAEEEHLVFDTKDTMLILY